MTTQITQRWRAGSHRWRRVSEGGFDPSRYAVHDIDENDAATFVRAHHYSSSWPAASQRYGLFDYGLLETHAVLVGVIVLGVPMSKKVLTKPIIIRDHVYRWDR